jgi:hypothetical protein
MTMDVLMWTITIQLLWCLTTGAYIIHHHIGNAQIHEDVYVLLSCFAIHRIILI